jgi:hypothetical protein
VLSALLESKEDSAWAAVLSGRRNNVPNVLNVVDQNTFSVIYFYFHDIDD